MATAYVAAAKLATKLGDHGSALLAADRAVNHAREANRPAMTAVAKYQVACALLADERIDDAEHVAVTAADELGPSARHSRPEVWSVTGSLVLLLAVVRARRGDARSAGAHLHRAGRLAEQLGHDGNWLWTGGRRCQLHLELARAAAAQVDDRLSVLHLLEAERVAPQGVSHNAATTSLLETLLRRERRGATPGLRGLGDRAGVLPS